MKKIPLLITLLVLGNLATAQNPTAFYDTSYEFRNSGSWKQSASILSLGLGFPLMGGSLEYSISPGFPALYVKYEHGFLRNEVGLGGYVSTGFGSAYENVHHSHSDFFSLSVAVLGFYHFNKLISIEKMDVYGGAGIGLRSVHYSESDYKNTSTVTIQLKVGIRYYLKPKFSFYAEGGFDGMTGFNLGVTQKLH